MTKNNDTFQPTLLKAHESHPRHFLENLYVYPVLSRRSGGISLGINLSPHKKCNFDCLYCQVDRTPETMSDISVSLERLETELKQTLQTIISGDLFEHAPFDQTPAELRRLNDIAFSGDGEPTAEKPFMEACQICCRVKKELNLPEVKIVVITNATMMHRKNVQDALALLDSNQGEIWAKLDAGTEPFYKFIDKTTIPFQKVLDNIVEMARIRPVVIQTLFTRVDGQRISKDEVQAYAHRLQEIQASGGQVSEIQLHTIARKPAYAKVSALSNSELDAVAEEISQSIDLPLRKSYGRAPSELEIS
jgi:wyosine [tRNA(Phe)-imidazoG37] synthetase (radical SAM superfamily)